MVGRMTQIACPKCNSDNCNFILEELGKAITAGVRIVEVRCNSCTYKEATVYIGGKEVFTETQLPGNEETKLEYKYLEREKS